MPRRSSTTPLYEVMVGRRDPRSRVPPRKEVDADKAAGIDGITDVANDRRSLLSGRSIRVPSAAFDLIASLDLSTAAPPRREQLTFTGRSRNHDGLQTNPIFHALDTFE